MSFGETLVRYRTAGAWSRNEIAVAAGVSSQYVQMLETGVRNPSPDTVERLVVALDLSTRAAGILRRAAGVDR